MEVEEVATGAADMEVVIEAEVVIVAAVVMVVVGTARDVLDPALAADLLTTEIGIEMLQQQLQQQQQQKVIEDFRQSKPRMVVWI